MIIEDFERYPDSFAVSICDISQSNLFAQLAGDPSKSLSLQI